jgi:hypothetical protein
MAELSREAMVLLELNPQWVLRPEFRPASSSRSPLLIVGMATTPAARTLWDGIAKTMVSIGFPHDIVASALMLDSPKLDQMVSAVLAQQPASVLCFGKALVDQVQSAHADVLSGRELISIADIEAAVASPAQKAVIWSALHQARTTLGFTR